MGSCRSLFPYMFPVADFRVPGHEFFQFLVGRGFAQVRQHGQHQQEVFVGFNTVGLGRLHQRIDNGTGFCALDAVAEQPVLSAYHKGTNRILRQIVGNRHIPIVQKRTKSLLLVQGIPHRIIQLAALLGMYRFQPCKILLQNGQNHILAVGFPALSVGVYVLLLQREQLRAVLESNRCLAGLHRSTIRYGLPPFPSGMSLI